MEIYKRLAAINKDITAIAKGQYSQMQKFCYRGIDDIMNELHGLFANQGVLVVPEVTNYEITREVNGKGTVLFYTRAEITHHFVAEDGSEVCTKTVGEAMDTGDKGMNKAMSIALKYALLQLFLIPTKEDKDPDAQSHEVQQPKKADEQAALNEIAASKTEQDLLAVWNKYSATELAVQGSAFYNAWLNRRREVGK